MYLYNNTLTCLPEAFFAAFLFSLAILDFRISFLRGTCFRFASIFLAENMMFLVILPMKNIKSNNRVQKTYASILLREFWKNVCHAFLANIKVSKI